MSDKIRLVRNDTRPALVCTITDENTGAAVGLSGATVRLKFRPVGSLTLTGTLTGTVTDPSAGQVQFNWSDDPAILAGLPGDYEGEIEITFADNTIQTVFQPLKFKMREDF